MLEAEIRTAIANAANGNPNAIVVHHMGYALYLVTRAMTPESETSARDAGTKGK